MGQMLTFLRGWDLGVARSLLFSLQCVLGWWFSQLAALPSWWFKASMQLWKEGCHKSLCSYRDSTIFWSKCSVDWCKSFLSISRFLKSWFWQLLQCIHCLYGREDFLVFTRLFQRSFLDLILTNSVRFVFFLFSKIVIHLSSYIWNSIVVLF